VSGASEIWSRWRVRAGYPLAAVFLWLATPTPRSLAAGAAVGLVGLLVRAAAAGHLRKSEALATGGPYAWTRNPLYLGSAILAAGLVLAARSWIAAALVAAYFAVFYPAVMKREEAELRAQYGAAFDEYAARVPRFWPRPARARPQGTRFSWQQYLRNHEYQAAIGFIAGLLLLALKMQLAR
jgi:protein-S-isoprenylcysteine O-methyltransferase Ste14